MLDRVRIEKMDHVAHVRLVRADKINALDNAMFSALRDAGASLREDNGVRAIVLSGDGTGFCAGLDIDSLGKGGDRESMIAGLSARAFNGMNLAQHVVMQWRELPVPVIAAVQDIAFGGGFQLILGADLRFVSRNARLSIMEIHWGLVPDMGGMYLLQDLVRPDVAAELVWSGRIFSGAEAAQLGLATRVCENPVAEALEFARGVAACSPHAIRAGKRLLSIKDGEQRARTLLAETTEQLALLHSRNHAEAVKARLAKRNPDFEPPDSAGIPR